MSAAAVSSDESTQNHSDSEFAIGVDIGGTNTKLAVVSSDRRIIVRDSFLTNDIKEPQEVCRRIIQFRQDAAAVLDISTERLRRVGVAVPGILDRDNDVLREVANLPQWTNFPLRKELQQSVGGSIAIANDANAAAYAEFRHRNLTQDSLALITLGTGTGCGVVLNGQPFSGAGGCGGEIGHVIINCSPVARKCGCGKWGHLEAYTGAAGVVETMRYKLDGSPTEEVFKAFREQITPELIAVEAENGSVLCQSAIDDTARFLGIGISVLCQTLNPPVVLLGGAMTFGGNATATGRRFLSHVVNSVQQNSLEQASKDLVIEFAALGSDAGMLGAAALAWSASEENKKAGETEILTATCP